jgi:hypothetical protein
MPAISTAHLIIIDLIVIKCQMKGTNVKTRNYILRSSSFSYGHTLKLSQLGSSIASWLLTW